MSIFVVFIVFNCHKFSFFSFVNCLLTALKQNEQIMNRCVALDNTFNVTFLTGLENFVETIKSKCETIFKRFGSFRAVVLKTKNFVCTSFLGKLGFSNYPRANFKPSLRSCFNLVPRAIRKAQFTQKLIA
jgi:hypothetical protein